MSLEYGFVFSQEDCIQCRGCEVACKTWRNAEYGVNWRRVHRLWSGSYPTVKLASASVSCMHCLDPACVKACPQEAISKRPEDGIVVVDQEKCVGCETCLEACPYGAPQFGENDLMQKCDLCGQAIDLSKDLPPCAATCPTQALTIKQMPLDEKSVAEKAMKMMLAG